MWFSPTTWGMRSIRKGTMQYVRLWTGLLRRSASSKAGVQGGRPVGPRVDDTGLEPLGHLHTLSLVPSRLPRVVFVMDPTERVAIGSSTGPGCRRATI